MNNQNQFNPENREYEERLSKMSPFEVKNTICKGRCAYLDLHIPECRPRQPQLDSHQTP